MVGLLPRDRPRMSVRDVKKRESERRKSKTNGESDVEQDSYYSNRGMLVMTTWLSFIVMILRPLLLKWAYVCYFMFVCPNAIHKKDIKH